MSQEDPKEPDEPPDSKPQPAPVAGGITGKGRGMPLPDWLKLKPRNPRWLLRHLVPCEAFVLISGQPKLAAKSYFAMLAALCVATGKNYAGLELENPGEPRVVLYYAEEDSMFDNQMRWNALCRSLEITEVPPHLIWIYEERIKLDEEGEWEYLEADVAAYQPALIILDTLKNMHNSDENSAQEMGDIVDTIVGLTKLEPFPSAIVLHHLGKHAQYEDDMDKRIRGSGTLAGAYNLHLALWGRNWKEKKPIEIETRGKNIGERAGIVPWEFEENDAGFVIQAKPELRWNIDPKRDAEEKALLVQEVKPLVAQLEPGSTLGYNGLAKLWDVSANEAHKLALKVRNSGLGRLKDDKLTIPESESAPQRRSKTGRRGAKRS